MNGELLGGFDELITTGATVLVGAFKFFGLEENVKTLLNRIVLIQFLMKIYMRISLRNSVITKLRSKKFSKISDLW